MISKTLARRLERLDDEMAPPEEDVLVIQIVPRRLNRAALHVHAPRPVHWSK